MTTDGRAVLFGQSGLICIFFFNPPETLKSEGFERILVVVDDHFGQEASSSGPEAS